MDLPGMYGQIGLTEIAIDFDMWFAKVIFQYHLAMAIVKEHMGHKVINPKATHPDTPRTCYS